MSQASGVPTQLGHIALRVRDVDRAVEFYRDVLGLQLKHRAGPMAFLGIRPDASHEIALFPLPADAPGPEENRVGMYHMAWEMASFDELAALNARLKARGRRSLATATASATSCSTTPTATSSKPSGSRRTRRSGA